MLPRNDFLRDKREYLTTEQVARWLGFSTRTITAWAQEYMDSGGTEGLPSMRLGRRAWRFDRTELEKWLQLKKEGSSALDKITSRP